MPDDEDRRGAVLIGIARRQLARALGRTPEDDDGDPGRDHPWLLEPGAVFVTLERDGQLRGCVGSLQAVRPLIEDVRENAVAAAFRDHRFPPLEPRELDDLEIEVTELSRPEPMTFDGEADALAQLRPGEDGVVLRWGERRATFLPQVWHSLPEPRTFLAQLKRKAGLAEDFWDDGVVLERYRARKWTDS
jgi:AmmeMemoRadiSam system protein A